MLQLPTVRTTYESSVDLIMLSSFLLIVVAQVLVFGQVETDVPRFPTPGTTWPSRIAAITRILEVHEIQNKNNGTGTFGFRMTLKKHRPL
jgi:hypothetical protein